MDESHEARLLAAARHARIVKSGNMSLGVNLLAVLVRQAARALAAADWDIEVLEMHHRHKVDAPSGTALLLGEAAAEGRGIALGQNSVSPTTGAIVRGPVGTSNPAAASRYPASKVSANGTGTACLPANRVIANPSAIDAPPPPAASGTQAWVAPASSSDCHSDAGQCPSSAALITSAEHCSPSNRSTVSTMIGSG